MHGAMQIRYVEVVTGKMQGSMQMRYEKAWEEVMQTSNEQGTLVLLENLNPEYTSGEVEEKRHGNRSKRILILRHKITYPYVNYENEKILSGMHVGKTAQPKWFSALLSLARTLENIAGKPQVPLEPWAVAYPNGLVNTNGPHFARQPAWEPSVDCLPITRSSPGPTLETMGYRIPIWLENSSFALFHPFDPQTAPLIPMTHTFPFLNLPGNPRSIFGPKHTELA
ncbi:hypothetical protein CQW23_27153 [Capsicum baccatum]|uniref:Uncharacterized protein n=1 Tax=Capsicum baccatum TaxID=33114 RepID=A0A2G2VQX1_CAPBA|nr:hypothetical protein CQW23_27153 [Capsicum baccatum]